jgi:hypothetical protein
MLLEVTTLPGLCGESMQQSPQGNTGGFWDPENILFLNLAKMHMRNMLH